MCLNVAEMPIKCPVAPLEFVFFADAFFIERGMRNKVNITYVTPFSGAFTKPRARKYWEICFRTRISTLSRILP